MAGDLDSEVPTAEIADNPNIVNKLFPSEIRLKFEIFSYRNAATILESSFPNQFSDIIDALEIFEITTDMIRMPGGSKGPIAKYVDTLFTEDMGWREVRITGDLHVKLLKQLETMLCFQILSARVHRRTSH